MIENKFLGAKRVFSASADYEQYGHCSVGRGSQDALTDSADFLFHENL